MSFPRVSATLLTVAVAVALLASLLPAASLAAEAVYARVLSSLLEERQRAAAVLDGPDPQLADPPDEVISDLHDALYASKIVSYAQGFMLLAAAGAWELFLFAAVYGFAHGGLVLTRATPEAALRGPDGRLLGQHDSWPAEAHRPTAVLPRGMTLRDVHYLTLSQAVASDALRLRVVLRSGELLTPCDVIVQH